jgi:peptidyl-prolyl cis-trans isomerase SurA
MKRQILLVGLSLLLVRGASGEIVERIVVKVNGDVVTMSEFEARQIAAVQANHITPDQIEPYLRENNAKILQDAVDDLLLVQRAYEIDVKVRPEYLKEVIDGIKQENHFENDQVFEAQLRKEGLSLEELKRNIERSILRRQVVSREVESKLQVTEADVKADYSAHMDEYRHKPKVHLQEIFLKPGEEALAHEILSKARAGEDFATLARTYSEAKSRASGGDIGSLASGELTKDLEKAAFSLPAGAISDPLVGGDGIRILRVVDKSAEVVVPFEEAKADILKRLMAQRQTEAYQKYIEDLRKTASVQTMVKEVPLQVAPQTPLGPAGLPGSALEVPSAGESGSEFSTTGQAAPERVVPGALEKPPETKKDEGKKDEKKSEEPPPPPS